MLVYRGTVAESCGTQGMFNGPPEQPRSPPPAQEGKQREAAGIHLSHLKMHNRKEAKEEV